MLLSRQKMKSTIKPGKPIINPSKYALISNNNNDDNPEEPWVENELAYRPRSRYYMFIWSPAWVVISLVLALILVIENVYFFQRHDATNRNTFEKGFDTELGECWLQQSTIFFRTLRVWVCHNPVQFGSCDFQKP